MTWPELETEILDELDSREGRASFMELSVLHLSSLYYVYRRLLTSIFRTLSNVPRRFVILTVESPNLEARKSLVSVIQHMLFRSVQKWFLRRDLSRLVLLQLVSTYPFPI